MATRQRIDLFRDLLVNNNHRFTNQREKILKVFLKYKDKHFNAEQLLDILKKEEKNIGLATVYRNLELFNRLGILKQIDFNDAFRYYELNLLDTHHHHLICVNCDKIIEFNDQVLEDFEKKLESEYSFKIKDHIIKFYGVCKDCKIEEE